MPDSSDDIVIRPPTGEDGMAVHRLIEACPPLDPNSLYCNLLQCSHFAGTCAIALLDGQAVGFLSGYRIPGRPDTFFVWQVAVHKDGRGRGLAKRLILDVLARKGEPAIRHIEATINPDNDASWGLFASLARDLGAEHARGAEVFGKEKHFEGGHESELLCTVGPFEPYRKTEKA